ncbi:MAG TPA: A24 family peptidase [Candidatus Binatia bacterium]|nr:A24 family peptidase [Candidatus Binatia bacterium]
MDPTQVTALAIFLGLAAAWDVLERRIPNALVLAGAIGAVALNAASLAGFARTAEGFLVGLGLLLVPFVLGWLGAGDAKFFAVVGAFLGPRVVCDAALLGVAWGGVFSAILLWRRRTGRVAGPLATVPYAVPLALGAVAALAFQWAGVPIL